MIVARTRLMRHIVSNSPASGYVMRKSLIIPAALLVATALRAQDPGASVPSDQKHGGNDKMHELAHVPGHPGAWKASDIELEQDADRPYVYLCGFVNFDVQIYDIRNTS